MIKAIALDIDGTITDDERELDVAAVGPIREAEKSGVPICLATGNVLCFARAASVMLGTTGPLISEDGGVVYGQEASERHILGGVKEVDEGIKVLEKEYKDIIHTETSQRRHAGRTLERTIDADEAEELLQGKGLNVRVVDSGFAIHIRPFGVSKGDGLRKVASILGVSSSEIAAIGDAPNDIEMFEYAGISYTPANASPKAKKASSFTMEGRFGSGVKEAIEDILENHC